ncbi:threonine-phosphate decarboxylase CobD [Thioalkalivibrio paradoxus]|nr:threonine-phosphate decarboxylase CobD [Thioalkalivibrio paradoxus]
MSGMPEATRLHHGGRLREAAIRYRLASEHWLDLSTGINPNGWPVPSIPPECWLRLPEDEDGLIEIAAGYYGADPGHLLAVAGSQAAIQALPRLRPACRVGIPIPGYAEHAHAWRACGHQILPLAPENPADALDRLDVLLLIHPNNPTGTTYRREHLLDWQARLAERGGWLVVDEAFIDADPRQSLAPDTGRPGLFVLRSLGKFFGLAGLRVGVVMGEKPVLQRLDALLGPWDVSHPARHVARLALGDEAWQRGNRRRLAEQGARLARLLAQHQLAPAGGTALFQWVCDEHAVALHEALACRGILTRRFDTPCSLRFGLPPDEAGWRRLATALDEVAARA